MNITSVLGFAAAVLTTLSFIPQVARILRTRETQGISLGMYVLFCLGVFLWLIYGLLLDQWPIILANGVTLLLSLMVLVLKIRHG